VTTAITAQNLGAWLLRCNPEGVWDLPGFVADGGEWIDDWSVVKNYRSEMMKPGDRVVLWVSGNGRRMARGIWGVGYITSYFQDEIPQASDADEVGYWLDEEARLAVTNSIDVDIPLFDTPVTDAELKMAGIGDLEVQRQPQGSNPSWISIEQLTRLLPLLPDWPDAVDTDEEQVTVSGRGAGFGAPATNKVVEAAAMAAVREFYQSGDWQVQDVSRDKLGWDLTCTSPDGEIARVEVKGVRGDRPTVLLTANEIRSATNDEGWVLAVVTRALSDPRVTEFDANLAIEAATAYVFRAELPSG
jgi:hypothetical protein